MNLGISLKKMSCTAIVGLIFCIPSLTVANSKAPASWPLNKYHASEGSNVIRGLSPSYLAGAGYFSGEVNGVKYERSYEYEVIDSAGVDEHYARFYESDEVYWGVNCTNYRDHNTGYSCYIGSPDSKKSDYYDPSFRIGITFYDKEYYFIGFESQGYNIGENYPVTLKINNSRPYELCSPSCTFVRESAEGKEAFNALKKGATIEANFSAKLSYNKRVSKVINYNNKAVNEALKYTEWVMSEGRRSNQTTTIQAQPHMHGDRSHTHGLPTQGIGHKHGNGPAGHASGNRRKPQVNVSALQKKLADLGYYSGPINGVVNQETRTALKKFMSR